mgnify:CR=1 FL=1
MTSPILPYSKYSIRMAVLCLYCWTTSCRKSRWLQTFTFDVRKRIQVCDTFWYRNWETETIWYLHFILNARSKTPGIPPTCGVYTKLRQSCILPRRGLRWSWKDFAQFFKLWVDFTEKLICHIFVISFSIFIPFILLFHLIISPIMSTYKLISTGKLDPLDDSLFQWKKNAIL